MKAVPLELKSTFLNPFILLSLGSSSSSSYLVSLPPSPVPSSLNADWQMETGKGKGCYLRDMGEMTFLEHFFVPGSWPSILHIILLNSIIALQN